MTRKRKPWVYQWQYDELKDQLVFTRIIAWMGWGMFAVVTAVYLIS